MKRFKCECGRQEFKVNPSTEMVQCWFCGTRYTWVDGKWKLFRITKVVSYSESLREFVQKPFDWVDAKLRHPKRVKLSTVSTKPAYLPKEFGGTASLKEIEKIHLRKKWAEEIKYLESYGEIWFKHHHHKGKLRGKHMAKAFHSDCKKLGIKTRLKFEGNKGIVEAEK